MVSRSRVETTTHGYASSIKSVTDSRSDGDSPLAEYIAGMTAGEIGKGHASAHADYLARVRSMEIYVGSSGRGSGAGGGDDSGLGDMKEILGFVKSIVGGCK